MNPRQQNKQQKGQFLTTNVQYILQNIEKPPDNCQIIEPFAGKRDLLTFLDLAKYPPVELYDIEPTDSTIIQRDTILNPPDYTNKFILTNPPYIARNKSISKTAFNKYDTNDLYKCFIKEILQPNNQCLGGILIIPINFWSSMRKQDIELRRVFLRQYEIKQVNIFEEQVFVDTTSTVCSFYFDKKIDNEINQDQITFCFYPSKKILNCVFTEQNNFVAGGEIFHLPRTNQYIISRLTDKNQKNTNILAKCVDDNEANPIQLCVVNDDKIFIDNSEKHCARSYATLIIEPPISLEKQKDLVDAFNRYLRERREQTHSMFLPNFRESNNIARKRMPFDLMYDIVGYLLETELHQR